MNDNDLQVHRSLTDTDIANAKRFASQHGQDVRYTPERGWFVWDGRRWQIDEHDLAVTDLGKQTALSIYDEVRLAAEEDRAQTFKHAKKSQAKRSICDMLYLARSEPGIPARLTDFDANGWLLNLANGTVSLRDGKLHGHDRIDLISNIIEIEFDPRARCDLWHRFIARVTDGNEELRAYLRRFVGYLLVGDTSEQSLHFLYGLGANGKTVFVEVLLKLMGDYAVAVSPDLIMLHRHGGIPNDIARLRGIRLATMNETAQGARFDEARLKDLTGSDTLSARFLHREFFDFRPVHRIIIRGNHKPAIVGTDEAIWRRLRLVPFTVSIPPDEQDHDLQHKLEAELPGILQWAIGGCLEWQREGLKPPPVITDAVRQYRQESDTLGRFVDEHCAVGKLETIKSSVFFSRYQQFAEAAGERWIPAKDLPAEMQRRGFGWKRMGGGSIYHGLTITLGSIE